ncbi:MAG: response regulator [Candidatus Omnitrophica bacterium]|nr:response regulator [Candidatus Omnitrophota bacterium]
MPKENKPKPICKILTVDDQMGIDSFFYEFFTVRNYEVFNALNGKEALKIVEKEKPRIILLDINMRGMDGIETLKKIREIDKDAVIIMVTGVKDEDTIQKAKDLGADDYITKPLSLEYLDKVVLLKFMNLQLKDLNKELGNI